MPMLDWRESEATNQTIFREMNEWAEEATDARLGVDRPFDTYICECSTLDAQTRSADAPGVRVRTGGSVRFAVALDHENPEIDRVLFENPRFATVEKFFELVRVSIARSSDPRR